MDREPEDKPEKRTAVPILPERPEGQSNAEILKSLPPAMGDPSPFRRRRQPAFSEWEHVDVDEDGAMTTRTVDDIRGERSAIERAEMEALVATDPEEKKERAKIAAAIAQHKARIAARNEAGYGEKNVKGEERFLGNRGELVLAVRGKGEELVLRERDKGEEPPMRAREKGEAGAKKRDSDGYVYIA